MTRTPRDFTAAEFSEFTDKHKPPIDGRDQAIGRGMHRLICIRLSIGGA